MGQRQSALALGQVQQDSVDLSSFFGSSVSINPTLLLMGGGFLLAAVWLSGSAPVRAEKTRKKKARTARISKLREEIKSLEEE